MSLRAALQPIADFFGSLNLPEPIVHWGHPLMMGIVIFVMGGFVGYSGWQARLAGDAADGEAIAQARASHKLMAPAMFAFMAMGSTGGLLALVMQEQDIISSPHFWTGMLVLGLLSVNALLALLFGGRPGLRAAHAYVGSAALAVAVIHAVFGVNLGLSF